MSSKAEAKSKIAKLVDELDQIIKRGEHKKLSEDDTRRILIEPLFEALGWNTKDFSQLRSQVESHREEGRGRVDYSFQINGVTKFLLEAKPLKADLDDPEYAKQVIDYAWHKSVTWAVLSDFEGLKIFNAEWKEDDVEKNRYKEFNYKEYLPRFEELWILSKESFEEGLIDKAAEEVGRKIKRRPVGEAIFDDLMGWRVKLLDSIKKLKQIELTDEDIEECVQKILDRLIFIRTCEDRGFEDRLLEGVLRKCEQEGREEDLYDEIVKVFQHYYFYDSELFKEGHPCEKLNIFPGTIKDIIRGFYHNYKEKIYYNFKEIPADVLGGIYEQYLGHILKRGKLVGGRPHRKEKGIYYTPRYIVDYIVKNTVGKLLEELPFSEAKNLKILDPACGSGSFLIRAYEEMENYLEKEGHKVDFARKVEVLQNNIYGVDLDQQAVEIAQLNLMMNSLTSKVKIPKLSNNIKRGNSLIDDPKVAGDKAFNWKKEFPEFFTPSVVSPLVRGRGAKEGGFDVIIGNPPYVGWAKGKQSRQEKDCYERAYSDVYSGKNDLFYYFIRKSVSLLKEGGILSFIISRYFLESIWAKKLRDFIAQNTTILEINDFRATKIFQDANVHTCILIIQKSNPHKNKIRVRLNNLSNEFHMIDQKHLETQNIWHLDSFSSMNIVNKINEAGKSITEYLDIKDTVLSALDKVYILDNEFVKKNMIEKKYLRAFISSKNIIDRYFANAPSKWIIHIDKKTDLSSTPKLREYLDGHKREILERNRKRKENLGSGLARPMLDYAWDSKKIFCPSRCTKNMFILDEQKMTGSRHNVTVLFNRSKTNIVYFLALLNTKLYDYYFKAIAKKMGRSYEYLPQYLDKLLIKIGKEDEVTKLANEMLDLSKKYAKVKDKQTSETERLKMKIVETDREIDQLVYKLYGLTKEDIGVVEGQ